jgi:cyclin-dependent kinase
MEIITQIPFNIWSSTKEMEGYIATTFFPLKPLIVIASDVTYGSYKLVNRIDSGAYGVVWEALDIRNSQKVAIKIQCDTHSRELDSFLSAFKELDCLQQLIGVENIVQLLDAFYINSTLFFVLEYCENTLHELVKTIRNISDKEQIIKSIFRQILTGLSEMNQRGLLHLDIKPKNILICSSGTVKICDFSISRKLNEIESGSEYQTAWYRSPEAVKNHLFGCYYRSTYNINFSIDIWSIGCMFFECITGGRILYNYDNSEKLDKAYKKHRFYEKEDVYIGTILRHYPTITDFIKTCLNYDNTERPTAKQLLEHDFFR